MYEARQNKEKVNRTIGDGNVVRQKMKIVKESHYRDRSQILQFTPSRGYDPKSIKINNIRYWKNSPTSFDSGQMPNINSNNNKYKRIANDSNCEVHSTITSMPAVNIRTLNANIRLPASINRQYVNGWHISVKDNVRNLGGWFNLDNNTRALGQYHMNARTQNATVDETLQANIILNNMVRHIL